MGNSFRATSLPRVLFVAAISTVLFIAQAHAAQAAHLRVLHTFCQKLNCGDGDQPTGSLAEDGSGDLFGVTTAGGAHSAGVVFGLFRRSVREHHYRYRALYHFCALTNCADGQLPNAPLIIGSDGSLYGTTVAGGSANDAGIVFRLSPPVMGRHRWMYTVLYNFCAKRSNCADGSSPSGGLTYAGAKDGLPYDGVSPLYGFTLSGGRYFGGVAYSLTPKSGRWAKRVLYAFCAVGGTQCTDGWGPFLAPCLDADGALYGVTEYSPTPGYVIKLSPGTGLRWDEEILHKFCGPQACIGGWAPTSLIVGRTGNLFGTTQLGGATNNGVVYKLAADGTEIVLHDFCPNGNCSKGGQLPNALVFDQAGDIYGSAETGGKTDYGTIFKLTGKSFKTIYNFCARECQDDKYPTGVIVDAAGNLFGNTNTGLSGGGTSYELTP